MSRLKADLALLLAAVIWGGAFVAQKNSFAHVGAGAFVAARFLVSVILVLPLAVRELRRAADGFARLRASRGELALLGLAFSAGVLLQQAGLASASVTNAGFFTGLYVVFVPLICRLFYHESFSRWVYGAAGLSLLGTFLLTGGRLTSGSTGDLLVLLCAVAFSLQVVLVGRLVVRTGLPLTLAVFQYAAVTLVAFLFSLATEQTVLADLTAAWQTILYAGVLSGGIAYTLQMVAQRYAPTADAAIIMSSESVFAALAGALFLGERLGGWQYAGCGLIIAAILLTEFAGRPKSVT